MKIELTRGYKTTIDDEDYNKTSHCMWQVWCGNNVSYAVNRNGTKLHRLIMNAKPSESIDHIDGDGLNNRKSNLRFASKSLNAFNNKKHKLTVASKYKGVDRNGNKWRCRISKNDVSFFIGRFNTEDEAARAYDREAIKRFGEYAKLNFPKEQTKK